MYLFICIFVFACQTPGNIVFEVLVSLPFRKYMVCMVQNLAQWRNDEMSRLWLTHWHTDWLTDRHRKVEQYSAEAESAIFYQNHFHEKAQILPQWAKPFKKNNFVKIFSRTNFPDVWYVLQHRRYASGMDAPRRPALQKNRLPRPAKHHCCPAPQNTIAAPPRGSG